MNDCVGYNSGVRATDWHSAFHQRAIVVANITSGKEKNEFTPNLDQQQTV